VTDDRERLLVRDLAMTIRLGYEVEADDPNIGYEMPPPQEVDWLAAWLVSEGWTRDPDWMQGTRR
jgi:hypothetical protein